MPRHNGNTSPKKKHGSKAWRNGSTASWRRLRPVILERDGYQCQIRMDGCTGFATTVDHVAGKANGDDPRLLRAACTHCQSRYDPRTAVPDPRLSGWWN